MNKLILALLLILATTSGDVLAQTRSIGVRFGAPMGITYKKYYKSNRAAEIAVGTAMEGWYGQYYRNAFRRIDQFDNDNYISHSVQGTAIVQGRYLLHDDIPIEGLIGKLEWYWGIGGLLKFGKIEYRYRDEANIIQREVYSDFDIGPEGIVGMEYTFDDLPITVFGEFSLMVELADQPGFVKGFSGVGARYRF